MNIDEISTLVIIFYIHQINIEIAYDIRSFRTIAIWTQQFIKIINALWSTKILWSINEPNIYTVILRNEMNIDSKLLYLVALVCVEGPLQMGWKVLN